MGNIDDYEHFIGDVVFSSSVYLNKRDSEEISIYPKHYYAETAVLFSI